MVDCSLLRVIYLLSSITLYANFRNLIVRIAINKRKNEIRDIFLLIEEKIP